MDIYLITIILITASLLCGVFLIRDAYKHPLN